MLCVIRYLYDFSKLYLYDFEMKLPKMVKKSLNVGFQQTEVVNLLFSLVIFMSMNNMEFSFPISEVNLIFLC